MCLALQKGESKTSPGLDVKTILWCRNLCFWVIKKSHKLFFSFKVYFIGEWYLLVTSLSTYLLCCWNIVTAQQVEKIRSDILIMTTTFSIRSDRMKLLQDYLKKIKLFRARASPTYCAVAFEESQVRVRIFLLHVLMYIL